MFALRGAGRGAGVVMGRRAVLLPALRVAAAAAAPPGSLLSVSREETLPDSPGRGEKSRPWARSQVSFNDGTRRTTAPAAMPRRCPTLKPPVSSTTKTRTMLGSEQGGGRPAGPACVSSTRRAAANYLRAGRPRRSLTARARRRLSGGKCDCGRGALRSVVLLEQAGHRAAAGAATPHDGGGRGDRVQGRRRRLWSSSRVRGNGCGLRDVDGRQRAAVASACPWPHCCQRDAARAGDPTHP